MADYIGTFTVLGRVARDPELREGERTSTARFSVASSRGFGERKKTIFFNCTAFGKSAEAICAHMKKGSLILVVLRVDEYKDKDGNTRNGYDVVEWSFAESREAVSGGRESGPRPSPRKAEAAPIDDRDIPF